MSYMKTLLESIDTLYANGEVDTTDDYADDSVEVAQDQEDTVTMDVPLLLRVLEYAREDAQDDMDLHDVTDRLIELGLSGGTLTMDHYDQIVQSDQTGEY